MEKKLSELVDRLLDNRMRRAVALVLAIIVTFTTTYTLILPAITLEKDTAETMSGISMGGNEQSGDTSTSVDGGSSDESGLDNSRAVSVNQISESKEETSSDQDTETTVVQNTEDRGAEPAETDDEVTFRGETEDDLDQDSAVSFDMGEIDGDEESQNFAIVETVPDNAVKDDRITNDKDDEKESDPGTSGGVTAAEEESAAGTEEDPREDDSDGDIDAASAGASSGEQGNPAEEEFDDDQEGILTARDESYIITMTYTPEADIPQDAYLQAEEILEEEIYDTHLEETRKALNEAAGTDQQTENGIYAGPAIEEESQFVSLQSLTADPEEPEPAPAPEPEIVYARFFDITILDADGNEVSPKAPVKVSIELLDADQEEEVIQSADSAQVVHFGEEKTEVMEAETLEDTVAGVSFDAEGFSVYGVVYTVDFHYETKDENEPKAFDFSMHGGSSVTLRELAEALCLLDDTEYEDIDAFLKAVEDVTFSDENLVKVVRVEEDSSAESVLKAVFDVFEEEEEENTDIIRTGSLIAGDWLLVSLAPFHTAEALTIVMKDGETIVIDVTDGQSPNLAEYVTDATLEIEGRTYGAGETWPVREGVDYALKLTFKEKGSRQFPQGGEEMVMEPADLGGMTLVPGQSGTFDIPMGLYGTVTGNQWWVDDDGKLQIKFGEDPDNLLTRSNNTYLRLSFNVSFHGLYGQIQFNDTVKRDWEANTDTDIHVTKSGHYNASTGKMEYTVTVTSTGHTTNIKVTDTFAENNLLTLDQNSITITPAKELAETGNDTGPNGFIRVIKEMSHDETVTITYTADVNESALGPNGRVIGDDGKNSVIVEEGGHKDEKTSIVHEIKFSDLDKVTTSQTETSDGTVWMSWEITANTERRASLVGSTITDRIDVSSKDIMKYAKSDGKVLLHVTGTDSEGNTYSRTIEVTPVDNQGQESWTWTVENLGERAGTPLSYRIAYDTIAEKKADNVTVQNDAENGGGGSDIGVGVIPGTDPDTPPSVVTEKEATAVTEEYIDWVIVINVPEEGFPDGLTVTDYIPWAYGTYGNANGFADRLFGAPTVSGLTGTETFTWNVADDDSKNFTRDGERYVTQTLRIDFYEDAAKNNPGLGGGPRTITISLRTQNDSKWLEYAMTCGTGDPIYKHINTGKVNDTDITAYAIPLKPTVEKEHRHTSEKDGLPVYEYIITLSHVTEEPVVIEDTFNGEYLEFYRIGVDGWDPYSYIAAAEEKYQLNTGVPGYEAEVIPIGPGKMTITAADLPRKENGSFYEYYRIYYSLKVKDAAALAALESQALKNGGKYTLTNTAVWGSLPDECKVDYEVKVISKDGYFATNHKEERKYTFVIDANPGSFDLSSGDTVELTDQHTNNLSVDYSSVKIYQIPAGTSIPDVKAAARNGQLRPGWLCAPGSIPWNFVGNSGTFTLADQTHYVIVYDAIVIGSGEQEFKNIADLEGFVVYKEDERTYTSGITAGGDIWEIKLLKYKDGLTSNGLQGATFQLFKGTGEYCEETDGTNTWWTEYKEPMKYGDTASTRERGLVGKDITFTTDSDGLVTIRLDEVNDGNELEGGVHYYLKEIESPAGYQIDGSTEYWSFTLTTDPDEVNYGDPDRRDEYGNLQWIYFYYNDILKISNTETTEPLDVVVNKSWFDKDGNPVTGEDLDETFVAKVRLMRKTDDGNYVPVKVEAGSDGPVITEVNANTEDSLVQLTKENDWSYTWNALPRVELGGDGGQEVVHRYAYKIEEVEVDGYVVSVSETETETVKTYALNNYRTPEDQFTDLTVNKVWQDAEGREIAGATASLPSEIFFELYRAVSTTPFTRLPTTGGSLYVIADDPHLADSTASEGDAGYGLYKLTGSDQWRATFLDLPAVETTTDGTTYYYAYYVKEIPQDGYTASYLSDGTTRTIVNREPRNENIDIGLEKKWADETGTVIPPPRGAGAVFTVHQQKASVSTGSSGQGDITVNLLDSNGELIASLMASDGDQLLLSGYHFASWQDSDIYAEIHYKRQYGTMYAKNLVEDSEGVVHDVSITVNKSLMAIDNVITLILIDKEKEDFSTLPVFSNTSSSGSTSYSDYEDTNVTRTVVLPTADGKWETTIRDLISQDAEGNLYRYYITEDSCSPAAASVTFVDQDGTDIRDEDKTEPATDPLSENVQVVVTNTFETTDFIFTKEWHDIGDCEDPVWHGDITVSVQRRIGSGTPEHVGTYTIQQGDSGFAITKDETTPDAPDLVSDSGFTFKISALPKNGMIGTVTGEYVYFVTEETVSGYRDARYSNPSGSSTEGEPAWIPSTEYALNNGKIINTPENSVELPAAGGPGTSLFTLSGSILILGAGVLLGRKRNSV